MGIHGYQLLNETVLLVGEFIHTIATAPGIGGCLCPCIVDLGYFGFTTGTGNTGTLIPGC